MSLNNDAFVITDGIHASALRDSLEKAKWAEQSRMKTKLIEVATGLSVEDIQGLA